MRKRGASDDDHYQLAALPVTLRRKRLGGHAMFEWLKARITGSASEEDRDSGEEELESHEEEEWEAAPSGEPRVKTDNI
jgi:hypothetical protein